jgi:hypothetical protein
MAIGRETNEADIIAYIAEEKKQLLSSHPALANNLERFLHPNMLEKLYFGLVLRVFTRSTLAQLSDDKILGLINLLVPDDSSSAHYTRICRGIMQIRGLPLNERLQENLNTAEYAETLTALARNVVTPAELEALNSEQIKELIPLKLAENIFSPETAPGALLIRPHRQLCQRLMSTLSPLRYEKILLGLSRKLFTPQELETLNPEQIYQLLSDKKLLVKPSRFSFSAHAIQSLTATPVIPKNWYPGHQVTLFPQQAIQQKIADLQQEARIAEPSNQSATQLKT